MNSPNDGEVPQESQEPQEAKIGQRIHTYNVGSVRPSQLLWSNGPGALIDLPNLSVITMGTHRWPADRCQPIEEPRLLAAVQKVLGPQVQHLRMPPASASEGVDPLSAEAKMGVPVRPFPRWLRCVKCGLLGEFDVGVFQIKEDRFRPERTQFVHRGCTGSKASHKAHDADAVPARFLLACRNGHLDDFPWRWFVHRGPSECRGTLRFFEKGASLQTENLWVKCDACSAARSLVHAFGKEAADNLPACRGRHPHLDHYDKNCDQAPRTILLGATNGWFPLTRSVLAIPQGKDPMEQILSEGWKYFEDAESADEIRITLKTLLKQGVLAGLEKLDPASLWEAIQGRKSGAEKKALASEGDIKEPEWAALTSEAPPVEWPHFLGRKTEVPANYRDLISGVLLLERLREVNALVGFTRVEAPGESSNPEENAPMAELCRGRPDWVPATEVHGEGIFIRFNEAQVAAWEKQEPVRKRDKMLRVGHSAWRTARKLDPDKDFPGIRYAMLHTLSHLLIRELALECGYNSASIRERIYSKSEGPAPMAGILLYTAAADSDGTLGGLVELGKPEHLGRILEQALSRAGICSSDPLCSKHTAEEDRSLHLASCHACSLVAETSCEKCNRYLDRALVVATMEETRATFFACETTGFAVHEERAPYGSKGKR